MQLLQSYCLRDIKSGLYGVPIFVESVGVAYRALMDSMKDGRSTVSRYPSDFQLFHIGEYSDQTGKFTPLPDPVFVLTVSDLVVKPKDNGGVEVKGGESIAPR